MANETLVKKILALSPLVEVIIRVIYYTNIKYLKKIVHIYRTNPYLNFKRKKKLAKSKKKINFKKILNFISNNLIKKGDMVILISSYQSLKSTGFSPEEVIESLLKLIGKKGTLAMSARPDFKINLDNFMSKKKDNKTYYYDTKKTKCNTGIIAQKLMMMKKAVRSRHPINSMVAIGPLAKKIMSKNLVDNNSLPHGKDSSWYKSIVCDAKIIAIGVDLVQAATITKTVEDVFYKEWPVKNWYSKKNFLIKDGKFKKHYVLKERSYKWILHYAERTMCKDFIKNGILRSYNFDGLSIEFAKSKDIFFFLKNKIKKSYPYFYTKFNLINLIR